MTKAGVVANTVLGGMMSLRDQISEASQRFAARYQHLAVLAAGIATLLAFGWLSPLGALASSVVSALWAFGWPREATDSADSKASQAWPLANQDVRLWDAAIWRQMMDAMTDPVILLDHAQNVIAANPPAHAIFAGLEGRPISRVHRDPELLSAVERALESRLNQAFDVHMVLPVERRLSGTATPLGTARQQPLAQVALPALLIILRDTTEFEQLAHMRADFVANASHELRTPLASLKGFLETLQGAAKDDPAAQAQFIGIMQEQADRMSRLIDDLLSLSRIEMRAHVAPTGAVDLVGVVGGVVQALTMIAADASVTIEWTDKPAAAFVIGDRDELVQVVQNLMQNAIKYGRRGGHVRVLLASEGANIVLVVADDGIGIAPQHLPRLTERFYRVSAQDSRERGGTGLGLAIVKHITNRHRGELRITSTLGKGSTFTVLIPRHKK